MKSQGLGLRVASIVFGFMSIVQLARLIIRAEVLKKLGTAGVLKNPEPSYSAPEKNL